MTDFFRAGWTGSHAGRFARDWTRSGRPCTEAAVTAAGKDLKFQVFKIDLKFRWKFQRKFHKVSRSFAKFHKVSKKIKIKKKYSSLKLPSFKVIYWLNATPIANLIFNFFLIIIKWQFRLWVSVNVDVSLWSLCF